MRVDTLQVFTKLHAALHPPLRVTACCRQAFLYFIPQICAKIQFPRFPFLVLCNFYRSVLFYIIVRYAASGFSLVATVDDWQFVARWLLFVKRWLNLNERWLNLNERWLNFVAQAADICCSIRALVPLEQHFCFKPVVWYQSSITFWWNTPSARSVT